MTSDDVKEALAFFEADLSPDNASQGHGLVLAKEVGRLNDALVKVTAQRDRAHIEAEMLRGMRQR